MCIELRDRDRFSRLEISVVNWSFISLPGSPLPIDSEQVLSFSLAIVPIRETPSYQTRISAPFSLTRPLISRAFAFPRLIALSFFLSAEALYAALCY